MEKVGITDVAIFDIETDGYLEDCTKIHSLVIWANGEYHSFADRPGYGTIDEGLAFLQEFPVAVAHNGIGFDYPALLKLVSPGLLNGILCLDSLTCTRLMFPNVKEEDMIRQKQEPGWMPGHLIGSHSLAAWGIRLGVHKGDFGEGGIEDWKHWSEEMQDYCVQDVRVTVALWEKIVAQNWDPRSIELEHQFARVAQRIMTNGIGFDEDRGQELFIELEKEKDKLEAELQETFPPRIEEMKTPAYWWIEKEAGNVTRYPTKGACRNLRERGLLKRGPNKTKEHPFNPGSRTQIAERLIERGWKPQEFTKNEQPKVSDDILQEVPIPEAQLMARYLLLKKRLGQLYEGDESWMNVVKDGVIHGYINTNGAVTGRCTHSKPNVAQVPRVKTKKVEVDGEKKDVMVWGSEGDWSTDFRALFRPTRAGWYQVGADAAGLELRVLAHFLGRHDDGAYARTILEADIHVYNRDTFGLEPTKEGRNKSKTAIYCLIYGGGNEQLGFSLGELMPQYESRAQSKPLANWQKKSLRKNGPITPERVAAVKRGMYARDRVLKGIVGYEQLADGVKDRAEANGYLRGLDGRRLAIRKPHAALNTLLQSGGALIVKYATVIQCELLEERGLRWGEDWAMMAHVHDEMQAEARTKEIAHEVGTAFVDGLKEVHRRWAIRCPLDGDFDIGRNWAETH